MGGALASPLELASAGEALTAIVIPSEPTLQERTAAGELAYYLSRISGASFSIAREPAGAGRGIFVGATRRSESAGPCREPASDEAWSVVTAGDSLFLCGGRPRGVLYAVYHFLEDVLGVRWWTPWDESVPQRRTLAIRHLDLSGAPAFGYRDIHGLDGPPEFAARNRLNGDFGFAEWSHGGRIRYGSPHMSHTFYTYVPPDPMLERHPEFFSERIGLRVGQFDSQLCLTDRGLLEHVVERLHRYVEHDRSAGRQPGEPFPLLYSVSQNDWGGACLCDRCQAVARREGSESGPLIEFVNEVARRISTRHPELFVDTLAYHYTFRPPATVRPRDNVIVRLSGLQRRDFAAGAEHPNNRSYREGVEGWAAIAPHLWIWDYAVLFGESGDLPFPSLAHMAADLRFYRSLGVEGMFVQLAHPIWADMRDMKLWVLAKLLEDPTLDRGMLVRTFADGYYGEAGRPILRYLAALERAWRRNPSRIRHTATPEDFAFLDARFLRKADRLFARAATAVRGDGRLERRVRHARMTLDRAIVLRCTDGSDRCAGAGFSLETIVARIERTWREQIERRRPSRFERRRNLRFSEELDRLRSRILPP